MFFKCTKRIFIFSIILFISSVIYTNGFSFVTVALHTCCVDESQCLPCIILDKQRDTLGGGTAFIAASALILPIFASFDTSVTQGGFLSPDPVTLKVRMNH